MKKRLISIVLSAVLACAALAGCATTAAPAAAPAATEEKEEAEAPAEEAAEETAEEEAPAEAAADDEITSAAGDAPMIFDADTTTFPEYVAAGYCADVTDVSDYADFPEDTLGQGIVDGKVYGVPLDVNAYCIFYNKDLFDELGLEVPTTNSELTEVCDKLVEAGVQPFSGGFAEQWCERIFVNNYADPATVMKNPAWYEEKMNGTSNFADDEAWKNAMETFVSYKKYWGDDPFAVTWADVQNDLASG